MINKNNIYAKRQVKKKIENFNIPFIRIKETTQV